MDSSDFKLHDAARRIAGACRFVVEPVLYEWERGDVQREFEAVILAGLEELSRAKRPSVRKAGEKGIG